MILDIDNYLLGPGIVANFESHKIVLFFANMLSTMWGGGDYAKL